MYLWLERRVEGSLDHARFVLLTGKSGSRADDGVQCGKLDDSAKWEWDDAVVQLLETGDFF